MTVDPRDWITVAALPDLGAASIKKLWDAGWTPEKLLAADVIEWQRLGLKQKTINALNGLSQNRNSPTLTRVTEALAWQERFADAHILPVTHTDYPALLREIYDPPAVIFVRGNLQALNLPQLAIVGSRNASVTGLKQAYDFSSYLSGHGLVITSGLALGIDASAHQGAVDKAEKTVAVFGTGIDKLYPARNRNLAAQILEQNGCWVSEFFPGTPPLTSNFPKRNRIISGMSTGVLVVEAALKSGSLITARMALEQNREVFAIPGALNNPLSKGGHRLIRDGAYLIESAEEIIEQIGQILGVFSSQLSSEYAPDEKAHIGDLSASESMLLNFMGFEVQHIDQISQNSGFSLPELSQLLVALELKGLVAQHAGGYMRL